MLKAIRNKFIGKSGQAGESLVEVLCAMLVAGLALMMLAMAISVSSNLITQGEETAKNYYQSNNNLVNATHTADAKMQVVVGAGDSANPCSTDSSISVKAGTKQDLPGGKKAVTYEAVDESTGTGE